VHRFGEFDSAFTGDADELAGQLTLAAKEIAALTTDRDQLDLFVGMLLEENLALALIRLALNPPHNPLSAVIRNTR
jgi:hypothetical protein